MLIPRPIRKFVAVFRGAVAPPAIFLSAALGFWFGLTPGWYGIHVLLLAVALIFAIHAGTFILFAALGKALCYAAAPAWYHLGRWVQDNLGALLDGLGSLPIIGLTDFSRCAVAGATVAGPILGLIGGLLLARAVSAFRRAWLTLDEKSERFRKFQSHTWVRWLDWLLLGKRAKDVRAVLQQKTKIVRIPGVIVAVALVGASALGLYFIQGDRLGGIVARQLTNANGAEVNLASFQLAPLAGRLELGGLQVTDPADPARNRVQVAGLTADASVWNLLRGRIVVDEVAVREVGLDTPREAPGRVLTPPPPESPAEEPFERERYTMPSDADVSRLVEFYRSAQEVKEKLEYVATWLPEREPAPPPPPRPEGYLEYLTARTARAPTPRVVIRKAVLEGVQLPVEQFGRSTLVCENLSDAPLAAGETVRIEVESHDRPARLKLTYHFEDVPVVAAIDGSVGDVDLHKLQASLSEKNPVKFESGTATAQITGTASRDALDLTLKVQTQNLQASTAGRGFLGLDPKIADEALRVIDSLTTTLRVVGPPRDPRLAFDAPEIREEFQRALVAAGKQELANRLGGALGDRLPEGAPDAGKALEDPLGTGKDALEGLLGGRKKKE